MPRLPQPDSLQSSAVLNPDDMIQEIRQACLESGQPVPQTMGELARCIFDSLALSYRSHLAELEELTGS